MIDKLRLGGDDESAVSAYRDSRGLRVFSVFQGLWTASEIPGDRREEELKLSLHSNIPPKPYRQSSTTHDFLFFTVDPV